MNKKLLLIISIIIMAIFIGGCGKEAVQNSIDGEYVLINPEFIPGADKNLTLIILNDEKNQYLLSLKNDMSSNEKNQSVVTALWDEDTRSLKVGEGKIEFSWFEYNIINIAPFNWVFNLEGVFKTPKGNSIIKRVKR